MPIKPKNKINGSYFTIYATCDKKYNSYGEMFSTSTRYFCSVSKYGNFKCALITTSKQFGEKKINELLDVDDLQKSTIKYLKNIEIFEVDNFGVTIQEIQKLASDNYKMILIDDSDVIVGQEKGYCYKQISCIATLYDTYISVATQLPNVPKPSEVSGYFCDEAVFIYHDAIKDTFAIKIYVQASKQMVEGVEPKKQKVEKKDTKVEDKSEKVESLKIDEI